MGYLEVVIQEQSLWSLDQLLNQMSVTHLIMLFNIKGGNLVRKVKVIPSHMREISFIPTSQS